MTLQNTYNRIRDHIDNAEHSDFRVNVSYESNVCDEAPNDIGLTWEYGEPVLHRTAYFSVSACFHNDVEMYIWVTESTNLVTGEVSTSSRLSKGDIHNFGATDFPEISAFVVEALTEMLGSMTE